MIQAPDYLAFHAHLQPGNLAVQDLTTGQSWSYRAFDRWVAQFAAALRARGIEQGDRVAALAKKPSGSDLHASRVRAHRRHVCPVELAPIGRRDHHLGR
jgi:acyl-CoA synthetase (AMP-forming)/AMP-acid ligase II